MRDIVDEKDLTELQQKRLNIVLSSEKHGISEASRIFDISRQTLIRWRKRYYKYGVTGLKNRSKKDIEYSHKMPKSIEQKIINYKKNNPNTTAKQIKKDLNLNYSIKTILKKINNLKPDKSALNRSIKREPNSLPQNRIKIIHKPFIPRLYFSIDSTKQYDFINFPNYILTLYDPSRELAFIGFSDYNEQFYIAAFIDLFFTLYNHYSFDRIDSDLKKRVQIVPLKKRVINNYNKKNSILYKVIKEKNIDLIELKDTSSIKKHQNILNSLEVKRWLEKEYHYSDNANLLIDTMIQNCKINYNKLFSLGRSKEKYSVLLPPSLFKIPLFFGGDSRLLEIFRSKYYKDDFDNPEYKSRVVDFAMDSYSSLIENMRSKAERSISDLNHKAGINLYEILIFLNRNHYRKQDFKLDLTSKLEIQKVLIQQGNISNCEMELKAIVSDPNIDNYPILKLDTYLELFKLYLLLYKNNIAEKYLQYGSQIADEVGSDSKMIEVDLSFGELFDRLGQKGKAKKIYIESYKRASFLKLTKYRIKALLNLIPLFEDIGKTDIAISMINFSIHLASTNRYFDLLVDIYSASIPIFTTNYDKERLVEIRERIKENIPNIEYNIYYLLESWNRIGFAEISLGNYEEAIGYLSKVVLQSDRLNIKNKNCAALQNIGVLQFYLKKYKLALKYYKKATKIAEDNNLIYVLLHSNLNIAKTISMIDITSEALEYCEKSLYYSKMMQDRLYITDCLFNKSKILAKLKRYDQSFKIAKRVMRLAKLYNQATYISAAHYLYGVYYTEVGKYKQAKVRFELAIESLNENLKEYFLIDYYYYYAILESKKGNYREALKLITDSLKNGKILSATYLIKDSLIVKKQVISYLNKLDIKG